MDTIPLPSENDTLSVNDTLASLPTRSDPSQFVIIEWIIFGTIFLTTTRANLLVLYVFMKSKKGLTSPTHYLLANLAAADFLLGLMVGLLVLPILITITTSPTDYLIWGKPTCSLIDYVHLPLCATSMLSMMGIAIERYIGVTYPLQHKQNVTKKRVLYSIVLIWILAFLLTSVPLKAWSAPKMHDLCVFNVIQSFLLFITFAVYWVPITTTVIIYSLIYRNAVKPFASQIGGNLRDEKYQKFKAKQITLTKKMGLVVGLMLLMFGPLFVTLLLCAFKSPLYSHNLLALTGWLRFGNSTVNPFVYAFAVPGYKREFFRIFSNQHRPEEDLSSVSETYDDNQTDSIENSEQSSQLTSAEPAPLGQKPTVDKVDFALHRFCTYCGNRLKQGVMKNQENHCFCPDCFAKSAEGKATFNSRKASSSLEFPPKQNQTLEPRTITTTLDAHKVKPTVCHILQEGLATELHNLLRTTNAKSSDKNTGNLVREGGNKLLSNLMRGQIAGPRESMNSVKRIRESVMMPIMERKSKMMSESKNPEEIDWDIIKELDEIIEKLNSTIILPLLMDEKIEKN